MTDPTESAVADAVRRWFELLNQELTVAELFSADAVVVYFPMGRGTDGVRLEGHAEIEAWAHRPPRGRFLFRPTSTARVVSPNPELPVAADGFAVHVGYEVSASFMTWSNTGDDTLHVTGDGRVCGVFHEPTPLPPEHVEDTEDDAI